MAVDWIPNDHGNNNNNNNEHAYSSHQLPSHTEAPSYSKRSMSMSRPSTQRRDSSPGPSPSSSPLSPEQPDAEDRGNMADPGDNDDSISPLDPRRFTPTLHASLVSEILNLRREMEGKVKEIDTLEVSLDHAKSESEEAQENLAKTAKENRSLKRQLNLLEGGSLSAVTELAKERDEAQDSVSDIRKRLEQTQKKLRTQEEQTDRSQEHWDNERQKWDEERRNLERKVHVVEGRLKIVLNEVAASQAANSGPSKSEEPDAGDLTTKDADVTDTPNRSGSVLGRRRTSTSSSGNQEAGDPRNNRISVISMPNGRASRAEGGVSLADELAFDEEEEYDEDGYYDERSDSRATFSRDRPSSSQSFGMATKARKTLGLSPDVVDRSETPEALHTLRDNDNLREEEKTVSTRVPAQFEYKDTGIQYTPPPSPPLVAREPGPPSDTSAIPEGYSSAATDNKQNYLAVDKGVNTDSLNMASSASQTIHELSPPVTPDKEDAPGLPAERTGAVQTASSSTQTEDEEVVEEEEEERVTPADETSTSSSQIPIPIPTIAIHPPTSGPSSPRTSVVLPPRTKNAACQTDEKPEPASNVQSMSTQTEEIRLDKRPMKLASSLLPSAIQDQPPARDDPQSEFPIPIPPYRPPPPRSPRRAAPEPWPVEPSKEEQKPQKQQQPQPQPQQQEEQEQQHDDDVKYRDEKHQQPPPEQQEGNTIQAYPGNNDNGPVAGEDASRIRRPLRSSSLFAGFDQETDEEQPHTTEQADPFSDEELIQRPMASYTMRYGKIVSKASAPATILDEPEAETEQSPKSAAPPPSTGQLQRSPARAKTNSKRPPKPKEPDIRRAAMISNSSAAHQSTRPRSPSAPNFGTSNKSQPPPFPVPVRLSSRKVPISSSEGAQSPSPYGDGEFPDDHLQNSLAKGKEPLRKVRSDVAVARTSRPRQKRSYSPPTISTESSATADSHQFSQTPPLPIDDITAPGMKRNGRKRSNGAPAGPPARDISHAREGSTATTVQPTSVVDAIAQTMVGEWMWKYVRRRRSFGMSDNSRDQWDAGKTTEEVSANISGSGTRHQRWVWLAPYERSIMWSHKQPASGSALMGKTGRKCRQHLPFLFCLFCFFFPRK